MSFSFFFFFCFLSYYKENNQTATSDTKRLVQELVQLKTIVRDREDQCKQFSLQIEQLEKAKKEAEESRSNAEEMLAEASDRINRVTEAQVELLQENQDLKAKLDVCKSFLTHKTLLVLANVAFWFLNFDFLEDIHVCTTIWFVNLYILLKGIPKSKQE